MNILRLRNLRGEFGSAVIVIASLCINNVCIIPPSAICSPHCVIAICTTHSRNRSYLKTTLSMYGCPDNFSVSNPRDHYTGCANSICLTSTMLAEMQTVSPRNEAPSTEYKFISIVILVIAGILLVLACLGHAIYSFVVPSADVIIDVNSSQDFMLTTWNPLVVLLTWPIRAFYFLRDRKIKSKDSTATLDGDVERGLKLADSPYRHVGRNELSRPQEGLHALFTPQRLHSNVHMLDLPAERMPASHAEYLIELPFSQVSDPETPTSQWSVFRRDCPPLRSPQADKPLPPLPSRSSCRCCSSPQLLRSAALWKRLERLPSGPAHPRTREYLAQFPRGSPSPPPSPPLATVPTLSPVAPVSPLVAGGVFVEDGRNVVGGENAEYVGRPALAVSGMRGMRWAACRCKSTAS
jgi:hypothetical protein